VFRYFVTSALGIATRVLPACEALLALQVAEVWIKAKVVFWA